MIFSVISIFPEMLAAITDYGITRRAFLNKICHIVTINPRDFALGPHHRVDDKTYGGGAGMVMKTQPLELAMNQAIKLQAEQGVVSPFKVYLSPQGKRVDQKLINDLLTQKGIILTCGRYEGVDERFIKRNIDLEISVADIVVSGGELPAMLLIDAIVRQLPHVLNDQESLNNESFMKGLLDYPHYTNPRNYEGEMVPEVLLNGNHEQIAKWRLQLSLWNTFKKRPELLKNRCLTKIESRLLEEAKIIFK